LTGHLNPEVYGSEEVVEAARAFLDSNPSARIRILHEEPLAPDHPLLALVNRPEYGDRVFIAPIPAALQEEYSFHFAIGDAKNLRFESAKTSYEAVVRFGDLETGQRLLMFFDGLERDIQKTGASLVAA
jgi:hypothetical protein